MNRDRLIKNVSKVFRLTYQG